MKIDRSRFLLLSTTLAAATAAAIAVPTSTGCVNTTNDGGGDNSTTPDNTTDSGSNADGSSNADADAGADAGACLGDKGAAYTCPAPADEGGDGGLDGGGPYCFGECERYALNFKSEVAKSVVDCMEAAVLLPTTEGCVSAAPECVTKALAATCEDETATAFCTQFVADCSDAGNTVTQKDCVDLVKGLNAAGRTALQSCVSEGSGSGCLPGTATSCFDTLRGTF